MKPFALKKSDAKINLKNYLLVCCLFEQVAFHVTFETVFQSACCPIKGLSSKLTMINWQHSQPD
jgi:hypothetical protein